MFRIDVKSMSLVSAGMALGGTIILSMAIIFQNNQSNSQHLELISATTLGTSIGFLIFLLVMRIINQRLSKRSIGTSVLTTDQGEIRLFSGERCGKSTALWRIAAKEAKKGRRVLFIPADGVELYPLFDRLKVMEPSSRSLRKMQFYDVVLLDDVDYYPAAVLAEGNPIAIARRYQETLGRPRLVAVSSRCDKLAFV